MMNLIAKRINLIGILLLAGFATATAALYFDFPSRLQKDRPKPATAVEGHSCAMHAQASGEQPDHCAGHAVAAAGAEQVSGVEQSSGGCCGGQQSSESNLPPGHPPVPGYNVPPGCAMSACAVSNAVE